MSLWLRPTALYWKGQLHQEVCLGLREGQIVEITQAHHPEAIALPGILSPAWVNAHTHLELSHLRGRIGVGQGMIEFLKAMGPQRGMASPEVIYQALEEARREGTTAFVSHQNAPLPPEAIPMGVTVQPLAEFFGLNPRMRRRAYLKARAQGYPLTPHSLYALSRGLHRMGRRPTAFPRSIHFYESLEEKLWLEEGRGPFASFFRRFCRRPYRPVIRRVLHRLARRAPALWLVHATEVPVKKLSRWMAEIPNLYVVVCPLANWHLFRRRPPVEVFRRWGERVLLGTDSLANSPTLSLWPTIRHLYQSGWGWEEILRAAVDTPRRWVTVPLQWVLVGPLSAQLGIIPETRAFLWEE